MPVDKKMYLVKAKKKEKKEEMKSDPKGVAIYKKKQADQAKKSWKLKNPGGSEADYARYLEIKKKKSK